MKIKTTMEYHLHILHPRGEKKMEPFDDTYGDMGESCLGACPTKSGCGDRCGKLVELLEDDHKELPLCLEPTLLERCPGCNLPTLPWVCTM